jgi:hypothetical protein
VTNVTYLTDVQPSVTVANYLKIEVGKLSLKRAWDAVIDRLLTLPHDITHGSGSV